jgi:TetR/AcrR family transcriptional regulator, mexJK operon transcriptional repressor
VVEAEEFDATSERILDAALDAFVDNGYAGTSTDQIVVGAAASKRTIYERFGGKEGLFRAVGKRLVDRARSRIVATDVDDSTSAQDAVERLARQIAASILDPRVQRFRRLVIAEAARFPELGAEYYETAFSVNVVGLSRVLAGLAERNLLALDDPMTAAHHLVALTVWVPTNKIMLTGRVDSVSPDEIDAYVSGAVRVFLAAYAP